MYTRRDFLKTVGLGTAALALPGLARPSNGDLPNIIFLLADDQRFDAMGCMGNSDILTPNMDQLAADGMIFDNHYDTTSICMASRAIIMTGMYEYKTGCNFTHGSLSQDKFDLSYPVLLRSAGYRSGFSGKFGFPVTEAMTSDADYNSYDKMPMDQFDEWRGWTGQGKYATSQNLYMAEYAAEYPHVSRALGAAAQDFIKDSVALEAPFCLSVSFKAPHKPRTPDPVYDHLYDGVTFSKPANWGPDGAAHLPSQALSGRQYAQGGEWYPDSDYQTEIDKYYRQVYGIDVAIGMIRDELNLQGVADNTIIIYTSDNGYFCGSHHMQGKALPYEEGSRAPLIIYDPRHPSAGKGSRCPALTGNIDMAPTILNMAGLPIPGNMDGKSLLPLLNNPNGKVRDSLFLIQVWPWSGNLIDPQCCMALSVVIPAWKFINWFYKDETMDPAQELYDMRYDRIEMSNEIDNPDCANVLKYTNTLYRIYLQQWEDNCVPGNGYPEYATLAALPPEERPTSARVWEYYE